MYFVFISASLFFEVNKKNRFITVNPLTFGQGNAGGRGKRGQSELVRNLNHIMILER